MINTISPPVLWPELQRKWRRLRANRADRRMRLAMQADLDRLNDRMLRDIGLHERPSGRPHRSPHISI